MNTGQDDKPWFEDWFNSPYYHLLYHKRNEAEAAAFVERMHAWLQPPVLSRALDLACGKGRHSVVLHRLGMEVTGIDLSPESIAAAATHETDGLSFYVHDMRRPFRIRYYNYVFNLFTSFGYFQHERENRQVLEAVHKGLVSGGRLIIDFFNAAYVSGCIGNGTSYTEVASGIDFQIKKRTTADFVVKEIEFTDNHQSFVYQEQVQLLTLEKFTQLLEGLFELEATFGSYDLQPFNESTSQRLILVARKRS